jgi:DNA polymerase IV
MQRWIMHVDMDAFFASVEQRDHEEYRGKPVIVGGLSPRGVVSTASYEARRFGVHSAMPMSTARRRCPDGIFLPGNFALYRQVSAQIFAVFNRFSPRVEPISIDEGFLDITGMERLMTQPRAYAVQLKQAIRRETGLVASVGLAPNKFLAKIASDMDKPDGLVVISSEDVERILWPLPVSRIWGVGKKTAERLSALGYLTIGQLAQGSLTRLTASLGQHAARQLMALAHGQDDRPVETAREAQSVGREITFDRDLCTDEEVAEQLLVLAGQVGWRLRRAGLQAKTIQLKIRMADFTTYTRRHTLPTAICYDEDIYVAARELFQVFPRRGAIRLLGISGSGFETAGELSLFADTRKKEELYGAIDGLKKRFGEQIITKAPLLHKDGRGKP